MKKSCGERAISFASFSLGLSVLKIIGVKKSCGERELQGKRVAGKMTYNEK